MGLIDFIKDVGHDIFGGSDEATAIQELIEKELGHQVKDLKVGFKDGTATLEGKCASQEIKEKAVLLAGNLKGVNQVDDSGLEAPEGEPYDFYTVVKGDSLSKIAKEYYGDPMKYPVLFEANKEIIKDPDLIFPGQVLRVPRQK